MFLKQLSVFIENREGRLERVSEALSNENINIIFLSLADTNEYGLLRMIVSNPEKAKEVLRNAGFSAILTDVVAVNLPHEVGKLKNMLGAISNNGINVEYMYSILSGMKSGALAIKTSDNEKTYKLLKENGFELLKSEQVYNEDN